MPGQLRVIMRLSTGLAGSLLASGPACGTRGTMGVSESGESGEGESGAQATEGGDCVPGQQRPCACTDGRTGGQVCADDGESYGPCVCTDGETGDPDTGDPDTGDPETGDPETGGPVDCLPADEPWLENVRIESNADVAAFAQYSVVAGSVQVEGSAVTSLEGLECLRLVGDQLYIGYTTLLPDLRGLDNLETVQGGVDIYDNKGLSSLEGLGALQSAGGLSIQFNNSLTSLTGLSSLDDVEAGVEISDNPNLLQCDAFALLDQLASFQGTACIVENKADSCPDSCG